MNQMIPKKSILIFVLVLFGLISISVLSNSIISREDSVGEPATADDFQPENRVRISDNEFEAVIAKESFEPAGTMDTTVFSALTDEDVSKIEDPEFLSFVNQIRSGKAGTASDKTFKVFIKYKDGEREKMEQLTADLDAEDVYFYNALNLISIQTRGNILASVLQGNETVISVNTDSVNELIETEPAADSGSVTLEGGTEALTEVEILHKAGFTGKGATVAIIDTGLDSSHEEFGGRVTYEKCFSTKHGAAGVDEEYYTSLCKDQKLSADSAYPYSGYPETVTHGSHVAGIAAGEGGIAPEANIIAVQVFSQYLYKDSKGTRWATTASFDSDYLKGLDYVYGLVQDGVSIAAVNLSLGSGQFYSVCDDSDKLGISVIFQKLNALGVSVVTAAGNSGTADGYDGWISAPACFSGAFTVGALDYNDGKPKVADYSSYNELVDILAPGTNIHSACLTGYCTKSGTSMATPEITGAIALVKGNFEGAAGLEASTFLQSISEKTYTKSGVTKKGLNFHSVFSETTAQPDPDSLTLPPPSKVTAAAGSGEITLSWEEVPGASGYKVSYSRFRFFGFKESDLINGTSYTISGLKTGRKYYFKVRSYDPDNTEIKTEFSSVISARPLSGSEAVVPAAIEGDVSEAEAHTPGIFVVNPEAPVKVESTDPEPKAKSAAGQLTPEMEEKSAAGQLDSEPVSVVQQQYQADTPENSLAWRWEFDTLPGTGFPAGRLTSLVGQPSVLSYGTLGLTIEIPAIDSTAEILSVPAANENFAVEWLGKNAGLLEGSDLPGAGISVIAAHNHVDSGKAGPFLFLMDLQKNDRIFIRDRSGKILTYAVYENRKLAPDDITGINALAKDDCLILITCEDEAAEGGYLFRRVVFAEPAAE